MMYVAFYSDTPFGQMPVLEVNGKALAQTHAILRYVAKEVGKYNMKYPKSIPPLSNTHTRTHTHTHTQDYKLQRGSSGDLGEFAEPLSQTKIQYS